MTTPRVEPLLLTETQIIFRNFSGKGDKFNPEGTRNFNVLLDDVELVHRLLADGWNVRDIPIRDPEDAPTFRLEVKVNYSGRPPKIYMVTTASKKLIDESAVSVLDWVDIVSVDLIINPYYWEVSGKKGIKAYLKELYVVVNESVLDRKYADLPDSSEVPPDEYDDDPAV